MSGFGLARAPASPVASWARLMASTPARIWGAGQEYCDCIFMIHGDRLIAYSPDSDVVRKYEFARDRDRFALRDEHGQTMVFQRVR